MRTVFENKFRGIKNPHTESTPPSSTSWGAGKTQRDSSPPSSTSGGQNLTRKSQEITNEMQEINQEKSRNLQQHHKCRNQVTQEINRQTTHKWGQEKRHRGLSTAKTPQSVGAGGYAKSSTRQAPRQGLGAGNSKRLGEPKRKKRGQ